jgi:hypothetical protein
MVMAGFAKLVEEVKKYAAPRVCHLGQVGSVAALALLFRRPAPSWLRARHLRGHLAEPAGVAVAQGRPQREAPAREPGLARRDHGSGCSSSCRTALADSGRVVTPSGRRIGEVSLNPFTMQ